MVRAGRLLVGASLEENVGHETDANLRSLCKVCHDACTMLQYGHNLELRRIDPSDANQRQIIMEQITHNLAARPLGQRRELLRTARVAKSYLFDGARASFQGGR